VPCKATPAASPSALVTTLPASHGVDLSHPRSAVARKHSRHNLWDDSTPHLDRASMAHQLCGQRARTCAPISTGKKRLDARASWREMLSLRGLRLGVRKPPRSTMGRQRCLHLWWCGCALSEM
jgi:hypothetical protein